MTIYRQFRVTYRKRLLVYSLLSVALATGNALFWLHKWHEQGVELCFADTMMTGVQPSFLLMLLIPPTLGLVHQLKFILEQPFVICALDNRARLARNLLAALLFIAFRAVMAVSIPSIALGALLFRGGKPCTWESGASYYAYMTGQTLITPVKTGSLIVWQAMTIWLTVLLVSILFLSINLSCESHQLGSILSWGVCLLALWMCSFPVTPKLYRLQKSVSFSVNRIAENTVWRYFLSGICILFLESLFLHFAVTRKDFLK